MSETNYSKGSWKKTWERNLERDTKDRGKINRMGRVLSIMQLTEGFLNNFFGVTEPFSVTRNGTFVTDCPFETSEILKNEDKFETRTYFLGGRQALVENIVTTEGEKTTIDRDPITELLRLGYEINGVGFVPQGDKS